MEGGNVCTYQPSIRCLPPFVGLLLPIFFHSAGNLLIDPRKKGIVLSPPIC